MNMIFHSPDSRSQARITEEGFVRPSAANIKLTVIPNIDSDI